jgi:hypothetical protein
VSADSLGGGVRSCSSDDEAAFFGDLNSNLNDLEVLVMIQCGGFSSGSNRNDPGYTASDLLLDELLKGVGIELAVTEWRDEGRVCSCECHG